MNHIRLAIESLDADRSQTFAAIIGFWVGWLFHWMLTGFADTMTRHAARKRTPKDDHNDKHG